jgi:pyrrolidone-carboxylate peptidase
MSDAVTPLTPAVTRSTRRGTNGRAPLARPRCSAAVRRAEPDVVVCFGPPDGRTGVSVERFVHGRGFVHVPLLPKPSLDTSVASMPLETLVRAARIVGVTSAAL